MLTEDKGESGNGDSEKEEGAKRTIHKYEQEWSKVLLYCDTDLTELKKQAITGNLRASRFRSVCWRALLGVFSSEKSNWIKELRRFRIHYQKMKLMFSTDPWENDDREDNPLNQEAGSTWNQHFCDMELKALIHQDIVRTSDEVDFFHKQNVQKIMLNVLFVYARENPEICYRQGMHEILAPLVFVLHCDQQALLHASEHGSVSASAYEFLDPKYIEADAYSLFCYIMDGIKHYYQINDVKPTATGYFPPNLESPILPPGEKSRESEIVLKLNSIRDNILVTNDKELAEYLESVEITLPLFGIRWLRLLFGREFSLQDLLVLWDAIFAEGKDFGLVDYILVTMLIAIRDLLIGADLNKCLMHLMKYPGAVDVTFVIEHALYLKDKQKYSRPSPKSVTKKSSRKLDSRSEDTARSGRHVRSQSLNSARNVTSLSRIERGQQQKSRTNSGTSLTDRFKKLSTKPGQWGAGKNPSSSVRRETETSSPSTASGTATGAGIVEGFALNDPTVLIPELHHAHSVMALCRNKLAKYHGIISQAVNTEEYPEALQALEGISELCGLLDSRKHSRGFPLEIEPAYEAGESRVEHQVSMNVQLVTPSHRSATPPNQLSLSGVTEKNRKKEVASTSKGSSQPGLSENNLLKTFSQSSENFSESKNRFPLSDPLKSLRKNTEKDQFQSDNDCPEATDLPTAIDHPVAEDNSAAVNRQVSEHPSTYNDPATHSKYAVHPISFVVL